jgi:2-polyprenyl-3-methyl-5-hydroxy-6-metoxy-1,4-benzoquinol methylase
MKDKIFQCPICEKIVPQKFLREHRDEQLKSNYDLFLCSICDAQHWFPLKNPGGVWYERDGRYAGRNIDPTLVPGLQHIAAMKIMKRNPGTLLDVGCGNGNFIAYAAKFGFDCTGFDFDRDGIESGKKTFGIEKLTVDDLGGFLQKNPENKYDWVTFFDVFEHIDNHNEFIQNVKSLLKDGGNIAMSIPHRDSALWLIPADLPPRHLTRWSPSSITNFLEVRGFTDVKVGFIPATLDFIITKFRWKYGKWFNFGLVGKVKMSEAKESYKNNQGSTSFIPKKSMKVRIVHLLAKIKDYVLFGIPGILVYIAMLGTKQRFTDMYIIATKKK